MRRAAEMEAQCTAASYAPGPCSVRRLPASAPRRGKGPPVSRATINFDMHGARGYDRRSAPATAKPHVHPSRQTINTSFPAAAPASHMTTLRHIHAPDVGSSQVKVMLRSLSSGRLKARRMDSVNSEYPAMPARTSKL